jgi:magnesium chelatase family protein
LRMAVEKYDLSARAYYRLIKVARTIADLVGREKIIVSDVAEALQYKQIV